MKRILKGFERIDYKENPEAEKLGTPFDLNMAMGSERSMRKRDMFSEHKNRDRMVLRLRVFLSLMVGICFLMRIGEHLQPAAGYKGTAQALLRRHITFTDQNDRPIAYSNVGHVKAYGVHVNTTHGKTDSKGAGRRNHQARQEGDLEECCPVCVMENFIMVTRDEYGAKEEDPLYHIPGLPRYTQDTMHEVMNYVMEDLHMGVVGRFTSHSLRYGGATMLAAAGFPQYVIEMYGGWAKDSKSLRKYIKVSPKLVKMVSAQMAEMAKSSSAIFFIVEAFMIQKSRRV